MHELSIAASIIEEATKIAQRERASSVSKICVSIGDLSGVERESLLFVFPLAAEGSRLEKASLEIIRVPATVRCSKCANESAVKIESFSSVCGHCGSADTSLIRGREIMITSLEIETDV